MRLMLPLAGLICCAALFGCSADTSYMPLEEGTQWSYTVYDSAELPTQITVASPKRVGQEMGWELKSSHLGPLEMGWKGPILRASLLSGTSFDPPLTMLDVSAGFVDTEAKVQPETKPGKKPIGEASWHGKVRVAGVWHDAEAKLYQTLLTKRDPDKKLARSEASGCRVTLTLTWEGVTREIITSYVKGRGIIRQTSKILGEEGSVSLYYLSGPVKAELQQTTTEEEGGPGGPQGDSSTPASPQNTPQGQTESQPGSPATESSPT